jgi:hypothetical protein
MLSRNSLLNPVPKPWTSGEERLISRSVTHRTEDQSATPSEGDTL